jgi:hypothetical protein
MDRSLWPDGVTVHQKDLQSDGLAKSNAILRRHLNTSIMGIVSGLTVSVGTDTTKIKITAGSAYTPSGELISITSNIDNLPLTDYSASALNYILLVYTEVQSDPRAHENLGSTFNTYTTSTYRISILTATQYTALLPTDTNLNNDAIDRAVLIGIVQASGVGVPISPTSIQNASELPTIITITQPTNITGAAIASLSSDLLAGTGTLTYIPSGLAFTWQAPSDTAGTPVVVSTDGEYTLESHTTGYSITILVTIGSLPIGSSDVDDTLTVSSLYGQAIPRFTANDAHHRHMLGSGTPTSTNPHGLSPEDLGILGGDTASALALHRKYQHVAQLGVTNTASAGLAVVNASSAPDEIVVNQLSANDYAFINGNVITTLLGSPITLDNIPDNDSPGLFELYVDGTGTIALSRRIDMTVSTQFTLFAQIIDIAEEWSGNAGPMTIQYSASGSGSISLNSKTAISFSSLSGSNGVIRAYGDDYKTLWIDFYIYPASRPVSNLNEVWQIYNPADTTRINSLVLATTHWSGNATGYFGYGLGAGLSGNTNDKRFLVIGTGRHGTAPGVRISVNAAKKQGYLGFSKTLAQDLIFDYDILKTLAGDASGTYSADALHTHPVLSSAISAEASARLLADSTEAGLRSSGDSSLQSQITTINTRFGNYHSTSSGVVAVNNNSSAYLFTNLGITTTVANQLIMIDFATYVNPSGSGQHISFMLYVNSDLGEAYQKGSYETDNHYDGHTWLYRAGSVATYYFNIKATSHAAVYYDVGNNYMRVACLAT